jgi:hypothetical protein
MPGLTNTPLVELLIVLSGLCALLLVALLVLAGMMGPEKIRMVLRVARLLHLELEATRRRGCIAPSVRSQTRCTSRSRPPARK